MSKAYMEDMRLWRRLTMAIIFALIASALLFNFSSLSAGAFGSFGKMQSWQELAAAKRNGELAKIPDEWRLSEDVLKHSHQQKSIVGPYIEGLLDHETVRLTRLDPIDIVHGTANGTLMASDVVKAFCKRAAYGHQMNMNLLEVGFDIALERARELDDYYHKHGKPFGPLHGLPITLKDHFHVKGMETTFAYVGWIGTFEGKKGTGKERVFQSELIEELVSLGAVVIGKSSLMTTTWFPETNNNIVGYQWSPANQKLSSGGSSGGEGAVQALRGSAMGFGSDSGGSVGMPAAFNGVFSHKPSSGRLSFKDAPASGKANLVIPGVVGILGPSVASLKLMFKSLQSTQPWKRDPFVLPLGYREELEYDPEKDPMPAFGIMKDDGIVRPHPPIARAMQIVEKALRQAGHQTVAWNPPSHGETADIHGPIARGDGCPDAWHNLQLSGEAIPEQLLRGPFPNGKLKDPLPLRDWEDVVIHMQDYRVRYQEYWTSTAKQTSDGRPVEAFIVPIFTNAGVVPDKFYHSLYSSFVNVLDYCSVVIQVTSANKDIDKQDKAYQPLNEKDKKNMDAYDAELYDGSPAAVQIIGKPHDEEKLLSLAQVVVDVLQKYHAEQ